MLCFENNFLTIECVCFTWIKKKIPLSKLSLCFASIWVTLLYHPILFVYCKFIFFFRYVKMLSSTVLCTWIFKLYLASMTGLIQSSTYFSLGAAIDHQSKFRLNSVCIPVRGGHRHLQIGLMLDINLISVPPAPSPQMYVSKVLESVWPEGQGSDS